MTCRLHPQAKEIIAKYTRSEAMQEDYIFPILDRHVHRTEQQIHNRVHKVLIHINRELKEWSKRLGLATNLTTYVARHTYATVLKRSGVSVALISESLDTLIYPRHKSIWIHSRTHKSDAAMQHLL